MGQEGVGKKNTAPKLRKSRPKTRHNASSPLFCSNTPDPDTSPSPSPPPTRDKGPPSDVRPLFKAGFYIKLKVDKVGKRRKSLRVVGDTGCSKSAISFCD